MNARRLLTLFCLFPVLSCFAQEGEENAENELVPEFKIGIFDEAGIRTFIEKQPEGTDEEVLNEALSEQIKDLAAAEQTPVVFFHNTNEPTPFIYITQPVERVLFNEALGKASPGSSLQPPPLPSSSKLGTVQIQNILKQILSNEAIQNKISEQFRELDGVPSLFEDVDFYEKLLADIEENNLESKAVRRKYGMTEPELVTLRDQAVRKLENNRQAFANQFARFYVQLIVDATIAEAEANGYTHVFQYQNGDSPRLAYTASDVQDITSGVAERLSNPESNSDPLPELE